MIKAGDLVRVKIGAEVILHIQVGFLTTLKT